MNALRDGLRTLTEALAGLDDPLGDRFSRIESRLLDLEARLDHFDGLASASPERPTLSPLAEPSKPVTVGG